MEKTGQHQTDAKTREKHGSSTKCEKKQTHNTTKNIQGKNSPNIGKHELCLALGFVMMMLMVMGTMIMTKIMIMMRNIIIIIEYTYHRKALFSLLTTFLHAIISHCTKWPCRTWWTHGHFSLKGELIVQFERTHQKAFKQFAKLYTQQINVSKTHLHANFHQIKKFVWPNKIRSSLPQKSPHLCLVRWRFHLSMSEKI